MAMVIQLLCMNVQLKLEKMVHVNAYREMKTEVNECITLIGRVLKEKSLKSLMRCYRKEISQYFDFEEITIMFYDREVKQLYTITHGDEEEQAYLLKKRIQDAKSEEEVDYIQALNEMRDSVVGANQLIQFPISTGLTSSVMVSNETYFSNKNPATMP